MIYYIDFYKLVEKDSKEATYEVLLFLKYLVFTVYTCVRFLLNNRRWGVVGGGNLSGNNHKIPFGVLEIIHYIPVQISHDQWSILTFTS